MSDIPNICVRATAERRSGTEGFLIAFGVRVVNAQSAGARTSVDLGSVRVSPRARVTTLAADPEGTNTETGTPVTPVTSTFRGAAPTFTYAFPPHSVTFHEDRPEVTRAVRARLRFP